MPTTSFQKKIKDYAALAGAVLAAGPMANAAVVCSDINQITTACGDRLFIDLDGNGTNDFVAVVGTGSGSVRCSYGSLHPLGSNAVAASDGLSFYLFSVMYNGTSATTNIAYAYALSYGADVAGNNFFGSGDQRVVLNTFDGYGNWIGTPADAYAGVRFDIDGNTHFGWIHISYTGGGLGSTHQIELLDAAYENVPNTTLQAGVMPFNCNPATAVPTLGQWGLISLALLLLTFGVVTIKNMKNEESSGGLALEVNKPSLNRMKGGWNNYFSIRKNGVQ